MIVVFRFRADDAFRVEAAAALATLASCAGFRSGSLGRATDDAELWALVTEWDGVGAYRRGLSSHRVQFEAVPVLARAIDEPGAFEVLAAAGPDGIVAHLGDGDRAPHAATAAPGDRAR